MHFNGFMCIRMRKLHAECQIKPMHVIESKLCRHLVFQMSFRNIQRQRNYRNVLGDRSELWPSIDSAALKPNDTYAPPSLVLKLTCLPGNQ